MFIELEGWEDEENVMVNEDTNDQRSGWFLKGWLR